MPSLFSRCNYAPHVCLHHICAVTLRKAIMLCFLQCNYARNNSKKSYAQCAMQPGAETAPAPLRTASHTTPPRAVTFTAKSQGFAYFLTFKLAHCSTTATQTATSWLSHLMTELFNYELPLSCPTTELFQSIVSYLLITLPLDWAIVSYLLITLPLDWAIQLWTTSWLSYSIGNYLLIILPLDWTIRVWATSWLLYHLAELFNCKLPLNWAI